MIDQAVPCLRVDGADTLGDPIDLPPAGYRDREQHDAQHPLRIAPLLPVEPLAVGDVQKSLLAGLICREYLL